METLNYNQQKLIIYNNIIENLNQLRYNNILANSNEKHLLREVADLIDSAMQAAGLKPVEE
jgi:hypothetical protein